MPLQTLICTCDRILARLPFPILEIHPDNGSDRRCGEAALLNHHLLRYFGLKVKGAKLTPSRPWQTNR